MTTATVPPKRLGFGALLVRVVLILALWVGLVTGCLHYVGKVWPKEYQIHQALAEQAQEKAMEAASPPPAAPANATAAPAPASLTPAASATPPAAAATAATAPAPAAPASAPASAAAPASTTAAPAAAAAANAKPPFDERLAGYDRTPFANVSIFFSIVISVYCAGTIIMQIFQYRRADAR
jgi:hypothetical protein